MYIKIEIYDNPFDTEPVVSKGTEFVNEAKMNLELLVEKAEQLISAKHDTQRSNTV